MDAAAANGHGNGTGAPDGCYPYDEGFQRKVVALMLREPGFLGSYADVIEPTYFDDEPCAILARLVLDFASEHQTRPPPQGVVAMLVADYVASLKMDDGLRRDL